MYLQKMQSIRQCVKQLAFFGRIAINGVNISSNTVKILNLPTCSFHLSSICRIKFPQIQSPKGFLRHNETIFPPQKPNEERRPAVSLLCYT